MMRRETMLRTRPKLGDTKFQVDYIALDENGECNPDDARHRYKSFTTLEAAREWCKANFAKAVQGFMEIDEMRYSTWADDGDLELAHWKYVGETEYYEGEPL